ncbi:mannosylglycerate hydrolase [Breznakia sp. PF5-3]|uniref:glycoside hydrolase family 38 N-terminal domain-containing protein n=1 Tax=unclassified Breznakia TaxID=2623764 RepID=UPI00240693D6|nr:MULTISPECIES: glycoside hydrolase family 38 C-terminal domain-containing protein [unclassified Breznakia]MDF9825420.1 mannosylglycerate hydrolase [Breznakia sp. PM6-1]MDF9836298.1 mannosylglycerate hydrolase [Breznakia sp. PF5-3]MDF9838722.1 mannosylglycerate hydrolase [Breznakia sp. PFB2-8]MDF9860753.1 mannosylglycerate hydrolase [Breznakia sp. PH5-24]
MKKTIHIVPHTHWDREWYFTSQRSLIYLLAQIKEVLKTLENDKAYHYYFLDAQSSLIEDYVKYYPEDYKRIQKLVSEGRLVVGPWYTQSDLFVVSSESVVRNLYYGIEYAQTLGHSMRIGYVPDSFGQGGNVPQIYKSFGIDKALFWRGIGDDKLKSTEFKWIGSDGTEILGVQMPFGYFYGANFPKEEANYKKFIEAMLPKLEEKSLVENIYFPNGFDQLPINKNLVQITEKLNAIDPTREYIISSPEKYFEALKMEAKELPKVYGELLEGKNSRVHKTIFSSRSDLKILNNKCENYLTNVVEPLSFMRYLIDGKYPHKEIESIWKLLFENAAHDSIGCCNSDDTNADIYYRYKKAYDISLNLVEYTMRMIAQQINQDEYYSFTVFNPLPYKRNGRVEASIYVPHDHFVLRDDFGNEIPYEILEIEDQSNYVLHQAKLLTPSMFRDEGESSCYPEKVFLAKVHIYVEEIPALGYGQFYLYPDLKPKEHKLENNQKYIENERYKVILEDNNSFTVLDKVTDKTYQDQIVFYENGDDGDSYNYSPPREDKVLTSYDAKQIGGKTIITDVEQRFELDYEWMLPKDLKERALQKTNAKVTYKVVVSVVKEDPKVHVKVIFDNRVYSHRLCVRFHSDIKAKRGIADQFFGVIERDVTHAKMDTWKSEGWTEAPIQINPMQSFVALSDEDATISVMTKGVREYEVVGNQYQDLQLTLFRTYSFMGKEELLYRPGRASGESIEKTPDAELLGEITCEFAINYEAKKFDDLKIAKQAKAYLSPMQIFEQVEFLNSRIRFIRNIPEVKTLPTRKGYFELDNKDVVVSACKKSEKENAMILRCFNPYLNKEIDITNMEKYSVSVALDEVKQIMKKKSLKHCEFVTLRKGSEEFDNK